MKVVVKSIEREKSVIEVHTKSGIKTITIEKTEFGHSYNDFAEWDMIEDQYYELEELMDSIMNQMQGKDNTLEIIYE